MSTPNGQLPNSKKVYVSGKLHREIGVPFREISLVPTKSFNGEIEINEPVRVYDTSGPWGDPDFHGFRFLRINSSVFHPCRSVA